MCGCSSFIVNYWQVIAIYIYQPPIQIFATGSLQLKTYNIAIADALNSAPVNTYCRLDHSCVLLSHFRVC